MTSWLPGATGFLLTFALHSTLLLGVVAVLQALLRDRTLALQECLGRVALWGALPSAALQWFAFGGARFTIGSVVPVSAARVPTVDGLPPAAAAGTAAADGAPVAAVLWQSVPLAIAALAAIGGLALLLRRQRSLRRFLLQRRAETSPRILAVAAEVADRFGLQQSQHVSRCRDLPSPLAFGTAVPEICLPERALELGDDELRAMLAHELAHLRRRDPFWLQLGAFMAALFPWQLLLLPVRRKLLHIAELRCDATAGACAGPLAVARCLLQVASWVGARERLPAAAFAMAARPSALRARVEAALAQRGDAPVPQRAGTGIAAAAVLVLTAAAPGAGGPPAGGEHFAAAVALPAALEGELAAVRAELDELGAERPFAPGDLHRESLWPLLQRRMQELTFAERRLRDAVARRAARQDPLTKR
jgi:beta-lactamase regulating signal transducer with metallopeptidase domain